jgi:hypothetical protein
MVVAGGNRNVNNMPEGPNGRPWSFKLLDYGGDMGTCEYSGEATLFFGIEKLLQVCLRVSFRVLLTARFGSATITLLHMALLTLSAEMKAIRRRMHVATVSSRNASVGGSLR